MKNPISAQLKEEEIHYINEFIPNNEIDMLLRDYFLKKALCDSESRISNEVGIDKNGKTFIFFNNLISSNKEIENELNIPEHTLANSAIYDYLHIKNNKEKIVVGLTFSLNDIPPLLTFDKSKNVSIIGLCCCPSAAPSKRVSPSGILTQSNYESSLRRIVSINRSFDKSEGKSNQVKKQNSKLHVTYSFSNGNIDEIEKFQHDEQFLLEASSKYKISKEIVIELLDSMMEYLYRNPKKSYTRILAALGNYVANYRPISLGSKSLSMMNENSSSGGEF